jgi:uncharacterized membrane protein
MPRAYDFRKMARNALAGNWLIAFLVTLLALVLGGSEIFTGFSNLSANFEDFNSSAVQGYALFASTWQSMAFIYGLIALVIGGAVDLGLCQFHIKLQRRQEIGVADLFSRFHIFGKALGLRLFMALFIILWSLLLVIPGIIAAYRYAMAPYLMSENPDLGIREAVNISKQMMSGHKGRLFCLDLSFIGWYLLASLAVGLVQLPFWLGAGMPMIILSTLLGFIASCLVTTYQMNARAAFFLDLNYNFHRAFSADQWQGKTQPELAAEDGSGSSTQ